MRTSMEIDIDDALAAEAMEATGTTNLQDAIEEGLRRVIKAAEQMQALRELRGIGWEGDLEAMRTDKPLHGAE